MTHHKIYIFLIAALIAALAVVFCFLPRTTYSELERRELTEFPEFSVDSLFSGAYARGISAWFSDTEPFREEFLTLNMALEKRLAYHPNLGLSDEETISYIAGNETEEDQEDGDEETEETHVESIPDVETHHNDLTASEESTRMGKAGILVIGDAPNARALMLYSASAKAGTNYAKAVNEYHREFGDNARVYCMPIPTSVEFYCPDKAKNLVKPESATINHIYESLEQGVVGVDCYTPLSRHAAEDIYLRTDHHWAPLGAYYAAQAFANSAGVPFDDIKNYDRHVVRRFVGTMYGYSKDISVKQSPEDFVYYTPKGVEYSTTYINYEVDKDMRVIGEMRPVKGNYFMRYNDGSGAAYSTFMGGDIKITQVKTSTANGRRLMVIKDSFGNAIPGYLFHSFEEVHVVDFRYFTYNMKEYVHNHSITDILFANGIFNSCGTAMANQYRRFLKQSNGVHPRAQERKPEPLEVPATTRQVNIPEISPAPASTEPIPVQPVEPPVSPAPVETPPVNTPPVEIPVETPVESPVETPVETPA